MLYLAEKYQVASLSSSCVSFLEDSISSENALVVLDSALAFEKESLIRQCAQVLSDHTEDILKVPFLKRALTFQTENVGDISKETIMYMVQMKELSISEVDLFLAVVKWLKTNAQYKRYAF